MGCPLQRRTNVREPAQRQGELLFQQAEELPGALALGLDLCYRNLRSQDQTGFVAGAGKRAAGEQAQHLVELEGLQVTFTHRSGAFSYQHSAFGKNRKIAEFCGYCQDMGLSRWNILNPSPGSIEPTPAHLACSF